MPFRTPLVYSPQTPLSRTLAFVSENSLHLPCMQIGPEISPPKLIGVKQRCIARNAPFTIIDVLQAIKEQLHSAVKGNAKHS